MNKLKITCANSVLIADVYDTPTAREIAKSCPINGNAILWGEEIYFGTKISVASEIDAREYVEVGELAFYPPMNAFCIFFGPTPVSSNERPRAADKVNVFGRIKGDIDLLKEVKDNERILVELIN